MEQITNYVKPELIVVAIALYFVGMALKQAQAVKDKYIPLILGGISVVICAMYVFATTTLGTPQGYCDGNLHGYRTGNPGSWSFYICQPADQTDTQRRVTWG